MAMLALPFGMSSNEFPYASLIERSVACSTSMKDYRHQKAQQQQQQLQQQLQLHVAAQLSHNSNVANHVVNNAARPTNNQISSNSASNSASNSTSNNNSTGTGAHTHVDWKPEHFPHKMYDLLEDVGRKGLDDIVSWLPDGKSFKIHDQVRFEQSIMTMYFSGMSSYKSFRRQLNLYGIYQHRHRPSQDANAYSHEFFIRGQRHLCDSIARKKTNPPKKKKIKTGIISFSKNDNNITEKNINIEKNVDNRSSSSRSSSISNNNNNNEKRGRSLSVHSMMDERNHMNVSSSEQQVEMRPESRLFDVHFMPMPENNNGSSSSTSITIDNIQSSSTSRNDDNIIRRNMLLKSIYDDELLTRPNPVDVGNRKGNSISSSSNNNKTTDVFQSFMRQYWEDLPNDISSTQVVDEIIATFH